MQNASLLSTLQMINKDKAHSEGLSDQLQLFGKNYSSIYKKDLSKLGTSDLSPKSNLMLKEIDKINALEIGLEEKRKEVLKLFENESELKDFRKQLIEETENKNQHSYARDAFNYGLFVETILLNDKVGNKQEEIIKLVEEIKKPSANYLENKFEINKVVNIPDNTPLLSKKLGMDAMEEFVVINCGSGFRANLDQSNVLNVVYKNGTAENKQIANFFNELAGLQNFKLQKTPNVKKEDLNNLSNTIKEKIDTQMTVGLEMEFLLLPKGGQSVIENYSNNQNEFDKINKGCGDYNQRTAMRAKYGFEAILPKTPNSLLLFSAEEIEEIKNNNLKNIALASKKDASNLVLSHLIDSRDLLKDYFTKLVKENSDNPAITALIEQGFDLPKDIINNLALLSKEELFFCDLFILRGEKTKELSIELDGVFSPRESVDKNVLDNILPAIVKNGAFYDKTLDTSRACEVAMGPYKLEELSSKKMAVLNYMTGVARDHGCKIQDRDTQVNVSFEREGKNILAVDIKGDNGKKKVVTNPCAISMIEAVQMGLTQCLSEYPDINRIGQTQVSVGFDRKKVVGDYLKDNIESHQYLKLFDKDSEALQSAYVLHRENTGKSGPIRFSVIKNNEGGEGIGVLEIRLIGNNSHIPYFDTSLRPLDNAIEYAPEVVLGYVGGSLVTYLINSDLKNNIEINKDGSIPKVKPTYIEYKKSEINPYQLLGIKNEGLEGEKGKAYKGISCEGYDSVYLMTRNIPEPITKGAKSEKLLVNKEETKSV